MRYKKSVSSKELLTYLELPPSSLQVLPEVLGSGANGEVRKGVLKIDGVAKSVAVKVIPHLDGEERKRFNIELVALLKASFLCKEGVTQLYGTCKKAFENGQDKFCLVMELYPRSVADLLKTEGRLPESRVVKYLSQLCRTL